MWERGKLLTQAMPPAAGAFIERKQWRTTKALMIGDFLSGLPFHEPLDRGCIVQSCVLSTNTLILPCREVVPRTCFRSAENTAGPGCGSASWNDDHFLVVRLRDRLSRQSRRLELRRGVARKQSRIFSGATAGSSLMSPSCECRGWPASSMESATTCAEFVPSHGTNRIKACS
jgi:hypothetical protein